MDRISDNTEIIEKDFKHKRRAKQKFKTSEKILVSLLIIALTLSTGFAAFLLFHTYYYETFWVNGQSMYPALNYDAEEKIGENKYRRLGENATGNLKGMRGVDLGIMDTHRSAINRMKRFDIVVLQYEKDDSTKFIKRVIGLPGDKIYFHVDAITDQSKSQNGQLYVCPKGKSNFELVEQPVDKDMVFKGVYPKYNSQSHCAVIGNDEVFVVGDNRIKTHSSDSRSKGPFKLDLVLGVAVAIEATCTIDIGQNNELEPVNRNYHWPRYV